MPQPEWYRRETWTAEDEQDFEVRLGRARVWNRAQYLRIQASHLADTGRPQLHRVALRLLDRMIEEYPDAIDMAFAEEQHAESLLALEDLDRALDGLRRALDAQRARPNVMTDAWLDFGWLVVERELTDLYDEAQAVLEEFLEEEPSPFPVHAYREHAIRALLAEARGEHELARREASRALEAAGKERTELTYHPHPGLVPPEEDGIRDRLRALAGRTT